MSTSFAMTRDGMIGASLRLLGVYGPADSIPAADVTDCAEALNILLKAWGRYRNLWVQSQQSITTVSGTSAYSIGPSGTHLATDKPLNVTDVFLRVAGVDTKIQLTSRYDYNLISAKTTVGPPTQGWYDPQIPNGTLNVYPTPNSNAWTIQFVSQRLLADILSSGANPDVPQEYYQLLKWCLADELALEYEVRPAKAKLIMDRAAAMRQEFGLYLDKVTVATQGTQAKEPIISGDTNGN